MWTRHDCVVLATAAAATFGLTVATFWPRMAEAVGEMPAVTTEVRVPTLDLGTAQVTAVLDPTQAQTVVLTVKNLTDQARTVEFTAAALAVAQSDPFSRRRPPSIPVWKQDHAINLQPGETKVLRAVLPAAVFGTDNPLGQMANAGTVPGSSYLTLASKDQPARPIQAVALWSGMPALPWSAALAKAN